MQFDESLFLDKIKAYNPVETALPEISEGDDDEPVDDFDITQV